MKRCFFSLALTALFVVGPLFAETVLVTGDNVNLRSAPLDTAEVISQVKKGNVLNCAGKEGEWFKVIPPQNVSLWVYGELVRDGVVAVSKLRVRGGQGINYKSVGYLQKGAKVKVRGQEGDWLKIAPPEGSYLWISTSYAEEVIDKPSPTKTDKSKPVIPPVEPKKKPVVKLPAKKPPMPVGNVPVILPVPASSKTAVSIPLKSHGSDQKFISKNKMSEEMAKVIERLRPKEGEGRLVQYKGTLQKSSLVWHRPSKYRLIMSDERGRSYTICYVLGDEDSLKSFVGKLLLVKGREYWVEGVRYSVVIPGQIFSQD